MEGPKESTIPPDGGSLPDRTALQSRPDQTSTEPAGLLGLLATAMGGDFRASLSSSLSMPLEVRPSGIQECSCAEFLGSVEEPSCCLRIAEAETVREGPNGPAPWGEPAEDRIWLEISPQIAFPIIDRLLGGSGRDWYVPNRPLTEIEQRLLMRVAGMAAQSLCRCWPAAEQPHRRVRWECGQAIGAFVQPPAQTVVLAKFTLTMGRHAGAMRLCVPSKLAPTASALADVRSQVEGKYRSAPATGRRTEAGPLELSVVVQDISLSGEELSRLQSGDVLVTDTPTDGEVLVRIGGIPKFYARLGSSNGKRAIQITRRIDGAREGDGDSPSPPAGG